MMNNKLVHLHDDEVVYKQIKGIEDYNKTTRCTYFLAVLFIKGSGTHYIDDTSYAIGEKQLHFLFPGQHHHWVTGKETVAHKIVVGKKIFESFNSIDELHFIRHNLHPVFKLSDIKFLSVNNEMESIGRDLHIITEDQSWKEIIKLRIDVLAMMMKNEMGSYIKNTLMAGTPNLVRDFWNLINQYHTQYKTIGWYASRLNISANYLNILCRKHLNLTASDMLSQRVIQEAKNQLRFSDKTVKEITFELGFESVPMFSTFFKRKSGFSPTQYRSI